MNFWEFLDNNIFWIFLIICAVLGYLAKLHGFTFDF